ncbi:MAG: transcriptional regulator, CdaR [Clostridia bacterium]|jgi:carbohydrate diacid regulator|nr:transcriptional regulator, CdaR [Clostridia bacterium]
MYISKRSAIYIVQEIGKIIDEKINMMNEEGIIIASSDPERIGSYHAAAKEVVEQRLQMLVVKNDMEYQGARSGINLAINFQDKIVGVIGVTGPYDKVSKYGEIIKKMTEILILDQYYKEQHDIDMRIKERYLDEWMLGDSKNINQQFIKRGHILQIDITLLRRVMVISFFETNGNVSSETQRMIGSSEQIIMDIINKEKNSMCLKSGLELLCAVPDCMNDDMIKLAEHMRQEIETKYPIKFCCGIDSCCEGYLNIHNSVIKAKKALKTSLRSSQKGIRLYESITMEIFQSELSNDIKLEYIQRIFKGCSIKEIENWIRILNVFYEEEGSIVSTAERLYMHKNTVQYKLNKIKEKTGYDPRSIRYSSLYYNAIHFYQDVHNRMVV